MPINKEAFYEGAAIFLLARAGGLSSIRYESPFFVLNDRLWAYLKYTTRVRSPWGFTFTAEEQQLLAESRKLNRVVLGLVCGGDGVASLSFDAYETVAPLSQSAVHVSCYRNHGKHYEVGGPAGTLTRKVAPSDWVRLLNT
ncbi:MAG: hypothetical protein WD872_02930 [Pirellulaceae bacterium]